MSRPPGGSRWRLRSMPGGSCFGGGELLRLPVQIAKESGWSSIGARRQPERRLAAAVASPPTVRAANSRTKEFRQAQWCCARGFPRPSGLLVRHTRSPKARVLVRAATPSGLSRFALHGESARDEGREPPEPRSAVEGSSFRRSSICFQSGRAAFRVSGVGGGSRRARALQSAVARMGGAAIQTEVGPVAVRRAKSPTAAEVARLNSPTASAVAPRRCRKTSFCLRLEEAEQIVSPAQEEKERSARSPGQGYQAPSEPRRAAGPPSLRRNGRHRRSCLPLLPRRLATGSAKM